MSRRQFVAPVVALLALALLFPLEFESRADLDRHQYWLRAATWWVVYDTGHDAQLGARIVALMVPDLLCHGWAGGMTGGVIVEAYFDREWRFVSAFADIRPGSLWPDALTGPNSYCIARWRWHWPNTQEESNPWMPVAPSAEVTT
jgi:hypothetical protein